MGQRMFVAIYPPEDVVRSLDQFLRVRPQMPWIASEQWHLTLAFLDSVADRVLDDLVERLESGFAKKTAPVLRFDGAGSFPHPDRASVLWVRPEVVGHRGTSLEELSTTAKNAASKAGTRVDGKRFTPHMTVARLRGGRDVTKWLQILGQYRSEPWLADRVELIASHLREGPSGRPRHEVVATFELPHPSLPS